MLYFAFFSCWRPALARGGCSLARIRDLGCAGSRRTCCHWNGRCSGSYRLATAVTARRQSCRDRCPVSGICRSPIAWSRIRTLLSYLSFPGLTGCRAVRCCRRKMSLSLNFARTRRLHSSATQSTRRFALRCS